MNTPAFWMICRSPRHAGSKTAPTTRYATLPDARRAAQDLADQSDAPFVILAASETIWPARGQQKLF